MYIYRICYDFYHFIRVKSSEHFQQVYMSISQHWGLQMCILRLMAFIICKYMSKWTFITTYICPLLNAILDQEIKFTFIYYNLVNKALFFNFISLCEFFYDCATDILIFRQPYLYLLSKRNNSLIYSYIFQDTCFEKIL